MPQMAPLMWTSLFTLFAILLLLSMIKISFSKKETPMSLMTTELKMAQQQKKLNWKW